jgi:hypothetical protein
MKTVTVAQKRELTREELDLVSGAGKVYAGWVGGFWFAHDADSGSTTVGAGNTYVTRNSAGDTAVIKT